MLNYIVVVLYNILSRESCYTRKKPIELIQRVPKNRAILVQKLWGEKKLSKSVFGYLRLKQEKKVPMAIKLEGGGGRALVARPLVDELFFLRLP